MKSPTNTNNCNGAEQSTNSQAPSTNVVVRAMSSCERCRRCKVKCDQKSPCDQCIRTKCESCVYYRFPPSAASKASTSPAKENNTFSQFKDFFRQNGLEPSSPETGVRLGSSASSIANGRLADNIGSTALSNHSTAHRSPSIRDLQEKIDLFEKELTFVREAEKGTQKQCYANAMNLKGVVSKTRLMGRSHFMYIVKQGYVSVVDLYETLQAQNPDDNILAGVEKCKMLGKAIKEKNKWHQPLSADLGSYLPSKESCDSLLKTYLSTFESVYRILHIPSFRDEYDKFWNSSQKASPPFMIKLLLVLAIGASFQYSQESGNDMRDSARKWVHVAHTWLTFPFTEKHVVSLTGVQIHCLLLLAREILEVGSDMTWLAAGSLLRTASLIGLHRDPSKFPGMTDFQIEMRRRLWATVTEICFQSSMSTGGLPMIDLEDSDCLPPRNLDDDQIGEGFKGTAVEKDGSVMTQTTVQRLFAESLPTRLQIVAALNNTIQEISYAETNRLGLELSQFYQRQLRQLGSMNAGILKPTTFQLRMLKLMHVGTLGSLHMPYAIQARKDPSYFFSRKTCLDVALSILTPDQQGSSNTPEELESLHYSRCLEIVGGGYFRSLSTIAALMIYGEFAFQDASMSMFMSAAESVVRQEMRRAIDHFVELTLDRLKAGERNIKGHLFSGAIRAQIDAREQGLPLDKEIAKSLKESLERCIAVLETRAGTVLTPGSEVMGFEQFALDNFPPDMIPEPFWWDDMDFDYQDMNFSRSWDML